MHVILNYENKVKGCFLIHVISYQLKLIDKIFD